ncbi:hypothetical protein LPJ63_003604 [Coemansia sp. RSA 2711]|nr:hypothetical protein LPJ63_003604 [Coemansia sp. RSA 2711]
MRPGWLKKDVGAAMPVGSTQSPVSSKIGELAASRSKSKSLSRPRIRELLTSAMIRLMERMIAELFPCANGIDPNSGFGRDAGASGPLPSFEEFLKHICRRTRTPLTCMCLALLYLTRLRANHPRSRGSPGSSYRLALSSLCVATKYLYDDAYHTCSWVQVSMGLFSQREVNQMEMEFMYFLHYQLGVTPTEWNQWIATLEAKLVARWQETGKAEAIYDFGLFLSYECCEPESQEAVRDVAWGEGGQSLLELLHNAIHLPGAVDPAKCSPSADSAVSDATCLPTPDPNSWFRIRSPALSGTPHAAANLSEMAAAPAHSASITPTTARFSDVAGLSDDYLGSASQPASASCVRNSYIEHRNASPGMQKYATVASSSGTLTQHGLAGFALRPSSVCSVPNATYASANGSTMSRSSRKASKYAAASHSLQRQQSELNDYDWRRHQSASPAHQLVPQMSSESMMTGYAQSADRFSGGTASIAQSHSNESHAIYTHGYRSHGTSVRIPLSAIAAQTHSLYGTGPRPTTAQRGAIGTGGYSEASFDRASERASERAPPGLPRVSSFNAPSQGAADARSHQPYPYSAVELSDLGAQKQLERINGPTAALSASGNYSQARHHGSSISTGVGGRGSAKSSSSSLRGNPRRQSWRHSSKHSAANFAQKLRSLAGFGWSGRGDDGKERGPDTHYGADDGSSFAGQALPLDAAAASTLGHDHLSRTTSAMYSASQNHYVRSSGYHTVHVEAGRRASVVVGQRAPLTSAHKGLEAGPTPTYEPNVDMAKYVAMQS